MEKRRIFFILLILIVSAAFIILTYLNCDFTEIKELSVTYDQIPLDADIVSYENLTLKDLQQMNGENLKVENNPQSDIPRRLEGVFSTHIILKEQDAFMALLSVRSFFHISDYDFCCTGAEKRQDVQVFFLRQLYKGLLVDDALFRVVAARDGTPVSVSGQYREIKDINIQPGIHAEEGIKDIPPVLKKRIVSAQLVIHADADGNSRLAWKYAVSSDIRGSDLIEKYLYVDAQTSEMLDEVTVLIE